MGALYVRNRGTVSRKETVSQLAAANESTRIDTCASEKGAGKISSGSPNIV